MVMFKRLTGSSHYWPFLLCIPLCVNAESAAAPSTEFWQYLVEFSDEQGEFIDPEDLAAIENLKNADSITAEQGAPATTTMQHSSSVRNINNEQKEANL